MHLEWILHPAAPYAAIAVGMALCLFLFGSLKRDLRVCDARWAKRLAALEQDYRSFLADYAGDRPADPIARLIGLVHRWRRFPWIDPNLPRQLLQLRRRR